MKEVTKASIAYIATQVCLSCYVTVHFLMHKQVRFALSSASVFSRTDTVTDSETFYTSILDLLLDVREQKEVDDLVKWWNR